MFISRKKYNKLVHDIDGLNDIVNKLKREVNDDYYEYMYPHSYERVLLPTTTGKINAILKHLNISIECEEPAPPKVAAKVKKYK